MKHILIFIFGILFSTLAYNQNSYFIDYDGYDESQANTTGQNYQRFIWSLNNTSLPQDLNSRWLVVDFDDLIISQDGTTFASVPQGATFTYTIDSVQVLYNFQPTFNNGNTVTFQIYDYNDIDRNNFNAPVEGPNPIPGSSTPLFSEIKNETDLVTGSNLQVLTYFPNLNFSSGDFFSIYMTNQSDTADQFSFLAGYKENCNDQELANESSVPLNSVTNTFVGVNGFINPQFYSFGQNLSCSSFYTQNAVIVPFITIDFTNFTASASSNQTLQQTCPGSTVNLVANAFGGSGNYSYSWSPSTGLSNPNSQNPTVTVGNSSQLYTVTITDLSNNNTSTATVTITSYPVSVNAGPDVTINCGQTTNINATASASGPGVTIDDITWNGNRSNPLQVNTPGQYTVTATNSLGCSAQDVVNVSAQSNQSLDFIIPSGQLCANSLISFTNNSNEIIGWDFQWVVNLDTIANTVDFTYFFPSTGLYEVRLVATNGSCSLAITEPITIQNCQTCNLSLPNNFTIVGPGSSQNSFIVDESGGQNCTWSASTNVSWINLISSVGNGNGFIDYTVNGCSGTTNRTGQIIVSGQGGTAIYTVEQNCSGGTIYCSGLTNINNCSGSITDGSGVNSYLDNSNCQWLIQPPNANSITLDFISFNTESFSDYVRVYDGATSSAPLLGEFSGPTLPNSVSSSSGSMLISFTTDGSITAQGWSANYTCAGGGSNLTVNTSGNQTICQGTSTTISAIASGGTGNFTYNWSDGQSGSIISVGPLNNTATYTVTVSDGNTSATASATITTTTSTPPCGIQQCTYNLTPTNTNLSAAAANGLFFQVSVTNGVNCQWNANLITNPGNMITPLSTSGSGNGLVEFNVNDNLTSSDRTAVFQVGNQLHSVVQAANTSGCGLPQPSIDRNNEPNLRASSHNNVSYQWYKNSDTSNILGTGQIFIAPTIGCYTVRIVSNTDPNCFNDSRPVCYTDIKENNGLNNFKIYPNPTTGEFYLELENEQENEIQIQVLSAIGKEVYKSDKFLTQGKLTKHINLSELASGIYFLNMIIEEENISRKLFIQK